MTCCKVTRVIEDYDLTPGSPEFDSMSTYLVSRWSGDEGSLGYRDLAALVNKRLLQQRSIEAGRNVSSPQIASEYRALRGDDEQSKSEVRAVLSEDGLDPDALESDFLSHMAIRRHFLDCLDLDPPSESAEDRDWEEESLEYARDRLSRTVSDVCSSLSNSGRVPDADTADIQPRIYLRCASCPTRTDIETAIEQGYVCANHH